MRRASVRPAPHSDAEPRGARWYRQPVAWLAVAVLMGSLAAMAATIVVAERYADEPLPVDGARVLKTPVARPADTPASDAADATQ
jgi:hypothetical protein